MRVIAHRGASARFPENSLAAFVGAVDVGADGVELDVRRTADRGLALCHDERLADGRAVVETALADLPEPVTDLASALDACRLLAVVNIEVKNWPGEVDFDPTERLADDVVALLSRRGELDDGRALVSSFHLPTIDRVHELAPALATGWLLGPVKDAGRVIRRAADRGHVAVHPHHAFVDEVFVAAARAARLQVYTWTCDDPDRIRRLADLGVDAVITNVPDLALEALGR